jgi:pyruvate dehydrogenase E1 component alpha subunit
VGAGIPIALGSAMAHAVRKTQGVAVCFFGDGAMAEGVLHESLNMAALWKLPLLLVCENNGWSEFSPTARQFAATLEGLATAFGLNYQRVDGHDVDAVAQAAQQAASAARAGQGAQVLECITHRVRGHFEGDPQKYRDPAELLTAASADPIQRLRASLLDAGCTDAQLAQEEAQIQAEVEAAIAAARADALPEFEAALADVYTPEMPQ